MTADNASPGSASSPGFDAFPGSAASPTPDGHAGPADDPVTAAATVTGAGRTVHVDYTVGGGRLLAGGPLALTVTIALRDGEPGRLISSSARSTGRSREYSFHGTLSTPSGETTLRDPYADAIEIGGVQTAQDLRADTPLVQRVLVNQFLTLEDVLAAVADGDSVELALRAQREVRFEGGSADDQPHAGAAAALRITLHRDDAALAAFYRRCADHVLEAAQADPVREQWVVELCTSRNQWAVPALTELARHPDRSVADRARQALADL